MGRVYMYIYIYIHTYISTGNGYVSFIWMILDDADFWCVCVSL